MSENSNKPEKSEKELERADKDARVAKALRDNLRRRKAAARKSN